MDGQLYPLGSPALRACPAYHPGMDDLHAAILTSVTEVGGEMVEVRRDLHRNPELGFEEHRTTGIVREGLERLGLEELACPTPTGAVYALDGGRPGATVLLRADMDALPITEASHSSVASVIDGRMHACGHDAHVAALLGAASALSASREALPGRFVFLFQPAEESLGGARTMIDGGVLDGIGADAVIGCHVTTLAPVGLVGMRSGIEMAEVHAFDVIATGSGGHGAMAGDVGNVLLAVAQLAGELGGTVEGLDYEGTPCSCSAGVLHAGTAANVVPSTASLRGTLRTFTPAHLEAAVARLRACCEAAAAANGCEIELVLGDHAPAVRNDPGVTDVVRAAARGVVGATGVIEIPPVTPSDDVSEFLELLPGSYIFVGAGPVDGSSGPHHSPTFLLDEGCLPVAAGVLATAAVDLAGRLS